MESPGRRPVPARVRLAQWLLHAWVAAWMFVRRIPALERAAWWCSDRLYDLALLIRHGSESFTLYWLEDPAPDRILSRLLAYNARASAVRKAPFTGKTWIAVVRCMDRKLDMSRIFGDMKFVDDIANPYGAVTPREIEALQLAVAKHGVRLVCLLSHTDCAALAIAHGDQGESWPLTTAAVDETPQYIEQLLRAPIIAPVLLAGHLAIIRATVITGTDRLTDVLIYRPAAGMWEPIVDLH